MSTAADPGTRPDPREQIAPAVAIALSVFVFATSIFAAVMAIGIAPLQMRELGISGEAREPSNVARWLCYLMAVLVLGNGYFSIRKGRKNLRVSLISTAVFVALNIALIGLFANTW